jgi:hypothetical protein
MNHWFSVVGISSCVGFVLATLRVVTLGRVTRQFSARSLGLGDDPRMSEVVAALSERGPPSSSWSSFVHNLSDFGFWQIFLVLWVVASGLCVLVYSLFFWASSTI